MTSSVIISGARTPFGRLLGGLSSFKGSELGGFAIKGALERAHVEADQVDYVIMGQVLTAGAGQMPARQASLSAGIPSRVPAVTVNKVCLSGIDSIILADQLIRLGECEVVVAGGQESMSKAPHLLPNSRVGHKYGNTTLVDSMAFDGLHDVETDQAMGALTDQCNARYGLTRHEQDEFSVDSHHKAAKARDNGHFDEEIVSVLVPQRRGEPTLVINDEGIRDSVTIQAMERLRPAFSPEGTITAGSASQISDGAAAVVVMSKDRAEALGLEWLAEIGSSGMVAGPDSSLQEQPANAIDRACQRAGINPRDLDLVEINEAFAAVGLVSIKKLGINPDRVNIDGGAIAIGHPLAASGTRVVLHLAHALRSRGGGIGAAALCGGGGQGEALIITVPKTGISD